MKSTKFILAISALLSGWLQCVACGPLTTLDANHIKIFRSCSADLEQQWQKGCRFQDYEKDENCILWQNITSSSIPLIDIERVVYDGRLKDIKALPDGKLSDNKFALWLTNHKEDLDYIIVAKEIEEIRSYMNNPWYYPYENDSEHQRLDELIKKCNEYKGKRHAERYALQIVRLYFAQNNFQKCIDLWENSVQQMPQNIITDMIASYVGGAYFRKGNSDKAIELYTRSQDIGSLINLKVWASTEEKSVYTDSRTKELEYIFNRFPNSPLLSVKLQQYVRNREDFVYNYEEWAENNFNDPVLVKYKYVGDSIAADDEHEFYDELKNFALKAASSNKCNQKGMWNYALAFLHYLDGDNTKANIYLTKAENCNSTPFIKESIKAFRFLYDASQANNSYYHSHLLKDLKWLDSMMIEYVKLTFDDNWQYHNKLNYRLYYWQDVARRVILGELYNNIDKIGNTTLALQLANYATNRIYQIAPLFEAYDYDDSWFTTVVTFDEYRNSLTDNNEFDFSSQFFECLNKVSADKAAKYAQSIVKPQSEFDIFLNEKGYVDKDYIYEIVGTLYLREMNYTKASEWLAKVSKNYQARTNLAKEGYFRLDPFKCQYDKKCFIADSSDYKLKFAQEMASLEKMMNSDIEPNRKANAKLRYATGLRNSFGVCWYLTDYGFNIEYECGEEPYHWNSYNSSNRKGFINNKFAQAAYNKVDSIYCVAITEFTDPEQAAQVQLDMMNFKTVVTDYPNTKAAAFVRGHCDSYHNYSLQKR